MTANSVKLPEAGNPNQIRHSKPNIEARPFPPSQNPMAVCG
jgi:hypothetical protein